MGFGLGAAGAREEGRLALVSVGVIAGLAVFAVLPQWVFYRDWANEGEQVLPEKIAAWAVFALAAAACPALIHRSHANPSGVALILGSGVVSILAGMFVYADTTTVDMIGPITALGSAGGGLMSTLMTGGDFRSGSVGASGQ